MASPAVKKAITEAASQYAKPEAKIFEYGTAGVGRIADRTLCSEKLTG
jgi:phosphoacetylglucosamine mutase